MFSNFAPLQGSAFYIIISLFLLISILWLIFLSILYLKSVRHYQRLTEGVSAVNLVKILEGHIQRVNETGQRLNSLEETVKIMKEQSRGFIQKIGLVRFNPYADTGGNQSFVVALLDFQGNGVVISSLHSRSETRVYGKVVKGGKEAGYPFSDEEKQAINKALEK